MPSNKEKTKKRKKKKKKKQGIEVNSTNNSTTVSHPNISTLRGYLNTNRL
eukprot:m.106771 g.106771  ORF g.106771 m.106771 type:complete len:50 (+) comp9162_c2_seq1:5068-5217(+)